MAWKEEHTHIHIHTDNKEVVCLLKEIIVLLKKDTGSSEDEKLKQDIMDGLNKAIADIKTTV